MNNANISIVADNSKAINQVDALTKAWNELNNTSEQSRKNLSQFNETAEGLNKSWIEINQGIYSAIGNIKELGNSIKSAFSYLREGADLAEAEMNFKAYTTSIGQSADDLMAKFRKATRNQVSDVELMKSATKALRVSGIKDIDALSKLYEIADTKGDLLGLSLQETFDKIVSAISSGNGRALIQLGVLPESFSRASNSADLLKNKALLLKEVIKDSQADFKSLANVGETASDKFNQIEAAVSNANKELKILSLEAVKPLIDFVSNEGIPVLKSSIDYLKDTVKAMQELDKETGLVSAALAGLGGAIGGLALYKVVDNFNKIGGTVGLLTKSIEILKQKQIEFNLVAKANPYIAAGAVAGLGAYLLYLKKGEWDAERAEEDAANELYNLDPLYRNKANQNIIENSLKDYRGRKYLNEEIKTYREKIKEEQKKSLNAELELQKAYQPSYISGKTYSQAEIASLKAQTYVSRQLQEQLELREKLLDLIKEEKNITQQRFDNKVTKNANKYVKENILKSSNEQTFDFVKNITGGLVDIKTIEKNSGIISKDIEKVKIKTQSLQDAFKQAFESVKNPEKAAETAIDNFAKSVTALNGPFGIMSNIALEAFATIEASAAKINLKDLTSQINRLSESEKELIEFSDKLQAGDYKAMLSFGSAVASGGKLAKEDVKDGIEKTGKSMYEEFSSATANAITDGLLSADFSGFRQNLGSILKGTVSNYLSDTFNSVLSGSNTGVLQNATNSIFKQVYTKNSKGGSSLNFGNLLTNVGIGLGVSWLTGEGGLFGKRKIKGGENIDKSNSLNAQVDNAKAIRDELLTAVGITEATRQALENAIFSYTWTTSHKNHNPFHRTKTYYLHGQEEAQASIDYLEKLQQLSQSEQANRNYQLWNLSRGDTIGSANLSYLDTLSAYEYMATAKNYNSTQLSQTLYKQKTAQQTIRNIQSQLTNAEKARNDYYQKLVEQYTTKTYDRRTRSYTTSVNTKAINRAMAQYDSQGIYSYQIKQLQKQLTQAQNNLATITAEYNKGNSNKYSEAEIAEAKLAAEEAKQALLTAQQSERTTFTSNFLNNSTLAGLYGNNASVISKLLGNDYSKFDTTSSIQQMLPMLEAAGLKDYDWQKRLSEAGTDTQKQIAVYQEQQSILESALKTYESIMKDNKEEALNTRLSVEEQQSAFERWQEAFNQVLAIQQEIADNTNTIAELEKSKYADTLADQLSDVMTVVAEAVRQTNGKETVIYYHSATGKEILAKLKAAIQNGNVKNADDLLTAINETEQLEIWG